MSGPSHCPYNANPHGALLLDHPGRLTCWGNSDPRPIAQHLVRQAVVDLVDAMALVRRHLWLASEGFHRPPPTLIYGESRSPCTTG